MAMMGSAQWNPQEPGLAAAPEDEFQQFLNMGGMGDLGDGINFDFQAFQDASESAMLHHQSDTQMGGTDGVLSRSNPVDQSRLPAMSSGATHPSIPAQMLPQPPTPNDAINEIDAQIQYLQQQRVQQQQRQIHEHHRAYFSSQNHAVPPTPQSLEMGPANNQFFSPPDPAQHGLFESTFQRRKDQQQDISFTPLVSPAVTPLDPQFSVDAAFSVPAAYFSPLTSPALHAQPDPSAIYEQRHHGGSMESPVEVWLEASGVSLGAVETSKRAKRTGAVKSRAKPNVRQSPISKPQRRKTTSSSTIVTQALSEVVEAQGINGERHVQALHAQPQQQPRQNIRSEESEENTSVSPEALSEMPPPPVPRAKSAGRSPFLQPETQGPSPGLSAVVPGKPSPATPASLMKLPPSSGGSAAVSVVVEENHHGTDHIDNLELPESAGFPKPQGLTPLDTQMPLDRTGDHGSAKNGFQPLPSPVFAKPKVSVSATQSPLLASGGSTPNPRKTPQLSARSSKKRTSSVHVSPALRPRISPNIKPLLPGAPGVSAEDTASRLLASKSNYQNILEGNTVPGVSYPSELSTNLTSKRTSHKIAEQGRRNRINSALQEIATLLPQGVVRESSDDGEGEKRDGKQSSVPNSKASTVELAIEYIRQLKQEVAEAKQEAAEAARRAEEAEKKLVLKAAS